MKHQPISEERREEVLKYILDVQSQYKRFIKNLEVLQTDSEALSIVSWQIAFAEMKANSFITIEAAGGKIPLKPGKVMDIIAEYHRLMKMDTDEFMDMIRGRDDDET